MIYVRHEHCAVAAAMAYARKSGDVGVATVTCGPGVTQVITALPAAVRAHLPLVLFAGEAPLKSGWYNQEIDQAPLIHATGAAYHRLHMPERMPLAVRDAFLQARRERRPGGDRHPVRSAGSPLDRAGDFAKTFARAVACPSPMLPHPDVAKARSSSQVPSALSCSRGLVQWRQGRALLAGRLPRRRVDCWRPRFPRAASSTTIRSASASRGSYDRGRPRVSEGSGLRRRGWLLACLPCGRRRPALAQGADAADRYRPGRGKPGPGGSAPPPASRCAWASRH